MAAFTTHIPLPNEISTKKTGSNTIIHIQITQPPFFAPNYLFAHQQWRICTKVLLYSQEKRPLGHEEKWNKMAAVVIVYGDVRAIIV